MKKTIDETAKSEKEAENSSIELPQKIRDRLPEFELIVDPWKQIGPDDKIDPSMSCEDIADALSQKYQITGKDGQEIGCEATLDGIKQYMQVVKEVAARDYTVGTKAKSITGEMNQTFASITQTIDKTRESQGREDNSDIITAAKEFEKTAKSSVVYRVECTTPNPGDEYYTENWTFRTCSSIEKAIDARDQVKGEADGILHVSIVAEELDGGSKKEIDCQETEYEKEWSRCYHGATTQADDFETH